MSTLYAYDFAYNRIREMKKYPEMWAWSEEAFILQVALLLEFAGLPRGSVQAWLARVSKVNNLSQQITSDRAKHICASALEVLP